MKNLLFICSENRLRSPTAEAVFSEYEDVKAIGAGTNSDAETPVSGDLIEWADVILVMEKAHKTTPQSRTHFSLAVLTTNAPVAAGVREGIRTMLIEILKGALF